MLNVVALGVLVAAENQASALVRVDIDLTSQTMHVRSGSGETYVWAISYRRGSPLTDNDGAQQKLCP